MSASFQYKEGAKIRGYAYRQLFNSKGMLTGGGLYW